MKKMRQILGLFLVLAMVSCGNSKSDGDKNGKDSTQSATVDNAKLPDAVTAELLEKAKKEGKSVFLVITGSSVTGVEKATANVNGAKAKEKNSVVYSLNRDAAENKELVAKFEIETVPVPFILVISPKGLPVNGGEPAQLTPEMILSSIPSPKQDEVNVAMYDEQPVFIVVSQKGLTDKESVLTNCKKASAKIESKPIIVDVDFDDAAEKGFLKQMGVSKIDKSTIVVVINASGQIADTFNKNPTIGQLVTAATKAKKKSSGCKPGECGSGSSCG
ncbi:MAG: hypothetical protein WCP69_11335 [Bacteroidota bacterium]